MKLELRHIAAVVSAGLVPDDAALDDGSKHDAALDALSNEAPVIRGWEAAQDNGPYCVTLRGVVGAYIVQAQEHDALGPFDTVEQAEGALQVFYGEFLKG